MGGPSEPSEATRERHARALAGLPADDGSDEAAAARGLVAAAPNDLEIRDSGGRVVWSLADYAFLREGPEAPASSRPTSSKPFETAGRPQQSPPTSSIS